MIATMALQKLQSLQSMQLKREFAKHFAAISS